LVMIEKCRAPSIIRKAISRQLWSTAARLTLQPSASAFATPAAIIFRLALVREPMSGNEIRHAGIPRVVGFP